MTFDGQNPWWLIAIAVVLLISTAVELVMAWQPGEPATVSAEPDLATAAATVLVAATVVLSPVVPVPEGLRDPLAAVAVALVVVGAGLRIRAILELRELFSPRVEVRLDHHLVSSGPYRFVQHPGYTGAVLVFVGLGSVQLRPAALAATVVLVAAVCRRAAAEERLLERRFGAPYLRYHRSTGRFLPRFTAHLDEPPARPDGFAEEVNSHGKHDDDDCRALRGSRAAGQLH